VGRKACQGLSGIDTRIRTKASVGSSFPLLPIRKLGDVRIEWVIRAHIDRNLAFISLFQKYQVDVLRLGRRQAQCVTTILTRKGVNPSLFRFNFNSSNRILGLAVYDSTTKFPRLRSLNDPICDA
jgi:hypothetical protein